MEEAIRGEGKKKKGAIIKLYIENFKLFNDTFGYDYGGLLLEEIARFMAGTLNADVYRYAGVEFISIMEGASFTQASEAVERVLELSLIHISQYALLPLITPPSTLSVPQL